MYSVEYCLAMFMEHLRWNLPAFQRTSGHQTGDKKGYRGLLQVTN